MSDETENTEGLEDLIEKHVKTAVSFVRPSIKTFFTTFSASLTGATVHGVSNWGVSEIFEDLRLAGLAGVTAVIALITNKVRKERKVEKDDSAVADV